MMKGRHSHRWLIWVGLRLAVLVAAVVTCSADVAGDVVVRVHAMVTEPGFVTREGVEAMLVEANQAYASVGISFVFSGFDVDADPLLKKDQGSSSPWRALF